MAVESHDHHLIALVDDDALFRESVAANLVDAGFQTVDYDNGPAFLDAMQSGLKPWLVLLDWKMPDLTGIEVLNKMRDTGHDMPVVFLTSLTDAVHEEAALARGAVDYVEKSRGFSILLRRIELIQQGVRGAVDDDEEEHDNGPLRIEETRALWRGKEVDLTHTEFRIVQQLATRPGTDIRYREIYDLVRGEGFMAGAGDSGYRTNVRTFIKRIRLKFRSIDPDFDAIENYPGYGYRWKNSADP